MLIEIPRTASNPQISQITFEEASAAGRAVIQLFGKWGISDAMAREILGGISPRVYARWKSGHHPRLSRDLATRLSLLMGIHKALRILFSDAQRGYSWVSKPNEKFNGHSPAGIMAEGSMFALARVRAYLDAELGAW